MASKKVVRGKTMNVTVPVMLVRGDVREAKKEAARQLRERADRLDERFVELPEITIKARKKKK